MSTSNLASKSLNDALQIGQSQTSFNTIYTGSGGAGGTFPGVYTGISTLTQKQQDELKDMYEKIAAMTGTLPQFPMPPTQEELTELEALEQQRQRDIRQQQIDAFKKVPAPIRQRLVDDILWARELAAMEVGELGKSARQLELESKKSIGNLYGGGTASTSLSQYIGSIHTGQITTPWYTQGAQMARSTIPSRMTEEDVIQAHTDATMAEECLNQD